MFRLSLLCAAFILCLASASSAATLTAMFTKAGPNVILEVTGTVDTTGYSAASAQFTAGGNVDPAAGTLSAGLSAIADVYFAQTAPFAFGNSVSSAASVNDGDIVQLLSQPTLIGISVPVGYISGTPLAGTSVFTNTSFAAMGMTPGNFGTVAGNTSFDIIVNPTPAHVPLPASMPLLICAMIGLSLLGRWHRARRARA